MSAYLRQRNMFRKSFLKEFEKGADPEDLYIFGSDYTGEELAVQAGSLRLGGSSLTAVNQHFYRKWNKGRKDGVLQSHGSYIPG